MIDVLPEMLKLLQDSHQQLPAVIRDLNGAIGDTEEYPIDQTEAGWDALESYVEFGQLMRRNSDYEDEVWKTWMTFSDFYDSDWKEGLDFAGYAERDGDFVEMRQQLRRAEEGLRGIHAGCERLIKLIQSKIDDGGQGLSVKADAFLIERLGDKSEWLDKTVDILEKWVSGALPRNNPADGYMMLWTPVNELRTLFDQLPVEAQSDAVEIESALDQCIDFAEFKDLGRTYVGFVSTAFRDAFISLVQEVLPYAKDARNGLSALVVSLRKYDARVTDEWRRIRDQYTGIVMQTNRDDGGLYDPKPDVDRMWEDVPPLVGNPDYEQAREAWLQGDYEQMGESLEKVFGGMGIRSVRTRSSEVVVTPKGVRVTSVDPEYMALREEALQIGYPHPDTMPKFVDDFRAGLQRWKEMTPQQQAVYNHLNRNETAVVMINDEVEGELRYKYARLDARPAKDGRGYGKWEGSLIRTHWQMMDWLMENKVEIL